MEKTLNTDYGEVTLKSFYNENSDLDGYEVYVEGILIEDSFIPCENLSLEEDEDLIVEYVNQWLENYYD